MHPPQFRPGQKLLDWPNCWLELRCICPNTSMYPLKLMAKRHGNLTFSKVLEKVVCSKCRRRPYIVHLCASPHRVHGSGGPEPDWSIPLRSAQWQDC